MLRTSLKTTIVDRIKICSDESIRDRVAHVMLELGKEGNVSAVVAALVLSADGSYITDEAIDAQVAGLP